MKKRANAAFATAPTVSGSASGESTAVPFSELPSSVPASVATPVSAFTHTFSSTGSGFCPAPWSRYALNTISPRSAARFAIVAHCSSLTFPSASLPNMFSRPATLVSGETFTLPPSTSWRKYQESASSNADPKLSACGLIVSVNDSVTVRV